ncbi:MAG: NADH-quinone oxidoreductase subunit M, partial [Actinobacteria bacterium]
MPWLTAVTFLPLAGAIIALVVPARAMNLHRWWALAITVTTFGVALGVLANYSTNAPGFQLVERAAWVPSLNFNYILGVDGISLVMVLLTAFLMPAAILVSWRVDRQVKYYMVAFLVLETAMI